MSIIVVARKGGQAAIAADSMQSDDGLKLHAPYVSNHEKIIRFQETYIGLAGWAAGQDIFESIVREHSDKLDFSSRAAIFETARQLHGLMKNDYHIDTQEEKDQPVESSQLSMMIANAHGIFEIDSYLQLERPRLVLVVGGVVVLSDALILGLQFLPLTVQTLPDPVQVEGGLEKLILGFGDGDRLRHAMLLSGTGFVLSRGIQGIPSHPAP